MSHVYPGKPGLCGRCNGGDCGAFLGTCYLESLRSMQSPIQILRAVTREWGHQGCLGHFQDGQKGYYQVQRLTRVILRYFHNFSVVDPLLVKSIYGMSLIGLQSFHYIMTQQFIDMRWQVDRGIIPFDGLLGSRLSRMGPERLSGGVTRP